MATRSAQSQFEVTTMKDFAKHIYASHGWRLLTKYFRLREWLLPVGSRRRRWVKYIKYNIWNALNIAQPTQNIIHDPYYRWIERTEPNEEELKKQRKTRFTIEPKISIIVPTFNTPENFLIEMLDSVLNQTYSNWELCIADGGSKVGHVKRILKDYSNRDGRMRVMFLDKNKGIAGNSNEAISLANGDFLALLDHDDTLAPFALFEVVKRINENHEVDFIYSDEDKITEDGSKRYDAYFKPDWSPDTMLSYNYICHLAVIKKEIIDALGGFREGFDGSQDYDLFLRAITIAKNISHIPKVLYHWRACETSTAKSGTAKEYAIVSSKKAISDYLAAKNLHKACVTDGIAYGIFKVSYDIEGAPEVSIIIPTRDKVEVLKKCISSVLEKTDYPNYRVIIVDNSSKEEKTFDYYREVDKNPKVSIINYNKPFNFSAINNYAVSRVNSDYILMLNNDTEVISRRWLTEMLEHAQRKEVGAVGAKLYYPDETVQHAGVIVGVGGVAGHSHKYFQRDAHGYFSRLKIIQNLSAVTAACMLIRKEVFEKVGGFDEEYSHAFNDVDLCMKIREKGYLIIYTPYAELYHHESISRGYENTPERQERFEKEIKLFQQRWREYLEKGDPYYNPNLTLDREDFSIR